MRGDGRQEDKIRAPVHDLVKALGETIGRPVFVHDEVSLHSIGSRPDLAVDITSGRIGYIELKKPSTGIPETPTWRPSKHDREQWEKLKSLPNLLYTTGSQWGLYENGVLQIEATLSGALSEAGKNLSPADEKFEVLFRRYLSWAPKKPMKIREIVSAVAPLCRLLRDQVADTIDRERTNPGKRIFTALADEWRQILFPNLDDDSFSDAYAQTVTFALLLARVDGVDFSGRSLREISDSLSKKHSLMGGALEILSNPRWVAHLSVVEMIQHVISNIEWPDIESDGRRGYAILYERFLAEYDPRLRRKSGTYYTPDPVAAAMVNLTDQILKERILIKRGYAAKEVIVVDPAMGTGTFLVEIINSVLATLKDERGTSTVPQAHLRELFSERLVGFELQVAPYAVAELRLHQALKPLGVDIPRNEVRFLNNTLDDPDTLPSELGQLYDVLKEGHAGANLVKRSKPVMVVIGNPPWRENARGQAPWIELRRRPKIDALSRPSELELKSRPSLDEFRIFSQRRRAFNLSNMWTFFWRWATWKAFDANPDEPAGIVALITPSVYLTSDSYAGMRRYLRETTDEGWIINLTPEGFYSKVSTRLFPEVKQPICIGIFARYGPRDPSKNAHIHHLTLEGDREQKLTALPALRLDDERWSSCPDEWEAPFQPKDTKWNSYPELADLLPWHQPGVKPNRNWVYAPDPEILLARWRTLTHADSEYKSVLFKNTRDRSTTKSYHPQPGVPSKPRPIQVETEKPTIVPIGFRSFDRQFVILDRRVIDYPRAELWQIYSQYQLYTYEPPAYSFSGGPALAFSELVPDMHYFMGHHGGRARPLYLDDTTGVPNVNLKLLSLLGAIIGIALEPEDLLAYIAGAAAHSGFSRRFQKNLVIPGVRIPITRSPSLWRETVEVGREIVWLHTYGRRYIDANEGRPAECPRLPEGRRPWFSRPVPDSEHHMPEEIRYDIDSFGLIIGSEKPGNHSGRVENVTPEMYAYTMGDMVSVVHRWFDYRQRDPRHKKRTSPLDDINSNRWTARYDDELLDLLNVIGRCVALESRQARLLAQICSGPIIGIEDCRRAGVLPVENIHSPKRSTRAGQTLFDGDRD